MKCLRCGKELTGLQKKYCSWGCSTDFRNWLKKEASKLDKSKWDMESKYKRYDELKTHEDYYKEKVVEVKFK